jgi:hypothetical protein
MSKAKPKPPLERRRPDVAGSEDQHEGHALKPKTKAKSATKPAAKRAAAKKTTKRGL